MDKNYLKTSFELPCGVVIKNRLVKAAMTERISNKKLEPNEKHHHLYRLWSQTGAGLMITGNIMIDAIHRESAGNVCVEDERILPKMKAWADAAKENDTQVWAQISHAGRQTNRFMTFRPLAPSEVQLQKMGLFGKPKAMKEADIQKVIEGFVRVATICKKAGFNGIQIHAAHGYLLSQFLSPKTNIREDKWGGSVENRSRLLLAIIEKTREAVGAAFPIAVKLNSSDFQKGGFSEEESLQVIKMLDGKIDLLEISGGTYEKVVFLGLNEDVPEIRESTRKREAYFLEFSKKVRATTKTPLLITGGFRSFNFCNEVLANNELDFIGMARPFITNIHEISKFLDNELDTLENLIVRTGIKSIDDSAVAGYYARQLVRLSKGKELDLNIKPLSSSTFLIFNELKRAIITRMG